MKSLIALHYSPPARISCRRDGVEQEQREFRPFLHDIVIVVEVVFEEGSFWSSLFGFAQSIASRSSVKSFCFSRDVLLSTGPRPRPGPGQPPGSTNRDRQHTHRLPFQQALGKPLDAYRRSRLRAHLGSLRSASYIK